MNDNRWWNEQDGMSDTMREAYNNPELDWDEISTARMGGMSKITAIKNVREITRLGLKEAKDLVEQDLTYPKPRNWKASPDMKVRRLERELSDAKACIIGLRNDLERNMRVTARTDTGHVEELKRKDEIIATMRKQNADLVEQLRQEVDASQFAHGLVKGASEQITKLQEQVAQLINVVSALATGKK